MRRGRRKIVERKKRMELCMVEAKMVCAVLIPSPLWEGRFCSASPQLYRHRERERESNVIRIKESDGEQTERGRNQMRNEMSAQRKSGNIIKVPALPRY